MGNENAEHLEEEERRVRHNSQRLGVTQPKGVPKEWSSRYLNMAKASSKIEWSFEIYCRWVGRRPIGQEQLAHHYGAHTKNLSKVLGAQERENATLLYLYYHREALACGNMKERVVISHDRFIERGLEPLWWKKSSASIWVGNGRPPCNKGWCMPTRVVVIRENGVPPLVVDQRSN